MTVVIITLVLVAILYFAWDEISAATTAKKELNEAYCPCGDTNGILPTNHLTHRQDLKPATAHSVSIDFDTVTKSYKNSFERSSKILRVDSHQTPLAAKLA